MPLVLDASVVLAWLLPDEQSEAADRIVRRIAEDRVFAPSLLLLEVGNALLQAQRGGRIDAAARLDMIAAFTSLPVMLEPVSGEAMIRASELAAARSLSLYDGCYLELAVARGCPLATFDKALARAAGAVGVALLDGG